jgi:hypothetical protein
MFDPGLGIPGRHGTLADSLRFFAILATGNIGAPIAVSVGRVSHQLLADEVEGAIGLLRTQYTQPDRASHQIRQVKSGGVRALFCDHELERQRRPESVVPCANALERRFEVVVLLRPAGQLASRAEASIRKLGTFRLNQRLQTFPIKQIEQLERRATWVLLANFPLTDCG